MINNIFKIRNNSEKRNVCNVCGKRFELIKDNKYVVAENNGINGTITGRKKFECFDCPHCGCQNVVNVREG